MLSRIIAVIILVPLAIVMVTLAVANREPVTLTLDPMGGTNSSLSLTMPLFIWLLLAMILGLVIGAIASWISQGRYRRLARRRAKDVERLERERPQPKTPGRPGDWPYGREDGTNTGTSGTQYAGLPAPSGTSRA